MVIVKVRLYSHSITFLISLMLVVVFMLSVDVFGDFNTFLLLLIFFVSFIADGGVRSLGRGGTLFVGVWKSESKLLALKT